MRIRLLVIALFSFFLVERSNAQCEFTDAPLGEICTTAEYICGSKLDGYIGKLRTKNITEVFWNNSTNNPKAGVCNNAGQFDNTSWFSFTACSKSVHLRIHFYNCEHPLNNLTETGIQTGLFSECRKSSSVACEDFVGSTSGVVNLQYNNFVPGQLVYFVLDGYAASVCEFRIEVVEGLDTTPVVPPDETKLAAGYISGPSQVACSNMFKPVSFNLLEPERAINFSSSCAPPPNFNPIDSVCYGWSVFPASGWNFSDNISSGKSVEIEFTSPGTYTISADVNFNPFYIGSCANAAAGKINTWTVTVLPENHLFPDPIFVCPGNSEIYCGLSITQDTTIICDSDPCNIVHQKFVFGTSKTDDLGIIQLCSGTSFDFQGIQYSVPGDYTILDNKDCALVHSFTIQPLDLQTSIEAPILTLDCAHPSVDLTGKVITAVGNTIDYKWYDVNNKLLGTDEVLSTSVGGIYVLHVNVTTPYGSCAETRQVRLTEDFKKPEILANVPLVRCKFASENPMITISALNGYADVEWTTPLGNKVNHLNIAVDSLNASVGKPYKLRLTGNNGCVQDTNFIVQTNFEKPEISLKGDDLTCYQPTITIEARTNISIDSIRWNKIAPDQKFYGSHLTKLTHEVKEPGIYQVDAMASASKCWNSETIAILDNMIYPEFSFANNLKWYCNTKSIDVKPITSAGAQVKFNWSTFDGKFETNSQDLSIVVESPGIYRLKAKDEDNGCVTIEDLIIEEETNVPVTIDIETDPALCFGEDNGLLIINTTVGGFEPYQYYLNNERLFVPQLDNLHAGTYQLEVRDKYDCLLTREFTITEPELFEIYTDGKISIAFDETRTLTFTSNYDDSDIASIIWQDEKGNVLSTDFDLDLETAYSKVIDLVVTTVNGCVSRSQIRVQVDNDLNVYFPNIFSPNGDGVNDYLVIQKNKIPAQIHKISIFDRVGNMVYLDDNTVDFEEANFGWDGTFKGSPVQPGVYVMLVELTDYFGRKQVLKQDITLIR